MTFTAAQLAYHASLRGSSKGPDSLKTRAAKSASHRAKRGTREWQLFYRASLLQLRAEQALTKQLKETTMIEVRRADLK